MGLLENATPDLYISCPECGDGEIKEETGKYNLTLDYLYCDNCGYEPEREDVLKHMNENADEDNSVYVCRECHEEISPDVQRCPNCGWKPEKKGGLWWGTTALMSFNPIGWAMGAKGVSDSAKASKGVAKKVNKTEEATDDETTEGNAKTPTEKLDELGSLREKGIITEEEFEKKKKEILKQF